MTVGPKIDGVAWIAGVGVSAGLGAGDVSQEGD